MLASQPVKVLDKQVTPPCHPALLDKFEECSQRVAVGVLPMVAEEGGLAEVVKGGRGVEAGVVRRAPGTRRLGLATQAIALGLVGGGEADVAVGGGGRCRHGVVL